MHGVVYRNCSLGPGVLYHVMIRCMVMYMTWCCVQDLVLLAVWTLLWLVSSSAWADGLSHVKYYTDPAHPWLKEVVHDCATSVNQCYPVESGNFATANVSVVRMTLILLYCTVKNCY